jgi:phospholipase C
MPDQLTPGLKELKHIVVLMMENRSFDHMLGYLQAEDPRIDGVDGTQSNPDSAGKEIPVSPDADYQSQLQPDPGHDFESVRLQIHGDAPGEPKMRGFVKAYFNMRKDVANSHNIMKCFKPEMLSALSPIAKGYALCTRWFSSLPGPTIPNRAFAHWGTSFGRVVQNPFFVGVKYKTIYERLVANGRTSKVYYYNLGSGTIAMTSVLSDQPNLFGSLQEFEAACDSGNLPDYSFVEPNYNDQNTASGRDWASDQHPDHHVLAGERFIASVYMNIVRNEDLRRSTLFVVVYDEHGGIYDHVEPPAACCPDEPEFVKNNDYGFAFDQLGVRVPAILISPWIPAGTVISDRVFDHASIPATVSNFFLPDWDGVRSPREKGATTFLDYLTLPEPRKKFPWFVDPEEAFSFSIDSPLETAPKPLPPPDTLNPARRISNLVEDNLKWTAETVRRQYPASPIAAEDLSKIRTEEEASEYMRRAMALLHGRATAAQ